MFMMALGFVLLLGMMTAMMFETTLVNATIGLILVGGIFPFIFGFVEESFEKRVDNKEDEG